MTRKITLVLGEREIGTFRAMIYQGIRDQEGLVDAHAPAYDHVKPSKEYKSELKDLEKMKKLATKLRSALDEVDES